MDQPDNFNYASCTIYNICVQLPNRILRLNVENQITFIS